MKLLKNFLFIALIVSVAFTACKNADSTESANTESDYVTEGETDVTVDRFADIRVLKYEIPGWDRLSLDQKKLVYYLTQAGYAGRDIIWDQNYRHNLTIRTGLENIVKNYKGDKNTDDWKNFMVYMKQVWFANGIHHHYSFDKFTPEFSKDYFNTLISETGAELSDEIVNIMFDPEIDKKKKSSDSKTDLLLSSAVNFYDPDITFKEAEAFYAKLIDKNDPEPISYGLNSKLVRAADGSIKEESWKLGGMYSDAIAEIIAWLEKAVSVAENEKQGAALNLLIEYYKTGDLDTWDKYNVAWVEATDGDIDYINSFIEVYDDPTGYRGAYENITQIKDFDASERMAVVAENVQWFEDNSTIMDEHKKKDVTGVSYKVVNVAGESGDASPSTPIGVNLPNANWIRVKHGSKSVSLGNITEAYSNASGSGFTNEFAYSDEEKARAKEHGKLSGKMHTALHEVIGHASGQINPGVGTPKQTLKNYSSALEEARADLVSLYFIVDQKIVDLGLVPSIEVGKAQYDSYIRNGLMLQLRRIKPGKTIQQSHMRNRQTVAAWAYEKGKADNVIEKKMKNGKTYFVINDYEKLRVLFGELLREIQRIKSEGDFDAGQALIENYGVQVDADLHNEVLERSKKLDIPPYSGFVNPNLVPVMSGDEITDVKVEEVISFEEQMLDYAKRYSFLTNASVTN